MLLLLISKAHWGQHANEHYKHTLYYITYSVLKCFKVYFVDVRNLKGVPLNNCSREEGVFVHINSCLQLS